MGVNWGGVHLGRGKEGRRVQCSNHQPGFAGTQAPRSWENCGSSSVHGKHSSWFPSRCLHCTCTTLLCASCKVQDGSSAKGGTPNLLFCTRKRQKTGCPSMERCNSLFSCCTFPHKQCPTPGKSLPQVNAGKVAERRSRARGGEGWEV